MALPLYLAMTAAEMRNSDTLPPLLSYMACHFSSYGTGLSNCPQELPEGAMLILNDRIPIHGHDRALITRQLTEIVERCKCSCLLLDFQRPEIEETSELTKAIAAALPCPVGVSDSYADGLPCPVFLPPAPLDVPLEEYLHPWQDREIWLEAALDGAEILLTEHGASTAPLPCVEACEGGHADERLHCHYHIHIEEARVRFALYRTREDVEKMLIEAEYLGVTQAVGLFQEFQKT